MLKLIGPILHLHGPLHLYVEAAGVGYRLQSVLQSWEGLVVFEVLIQELAESMLLCFVVHLEMSEQRQSDYP